MTVCVCVQWLEFGLSPKLIEWWQNKMNKVAKKNVAYSSRLT